ncbi:MAG: HD domain-containing phosphohydrolase [Gemmatimonadales bacterium]
MTTRSTHRILVVDDDPEIRKAHARLVEALGYEAETAADGIGALAMLSLDIDMMLLDGEMPNMDGFEVARRVREHREHAHIPIVMVTGLTRPADRRRAMEVGINDFINKPVDAEDLGLKAKWLLDLKSAYDRLRDHEAELTRTVEAKTQALRTALTRMTEAQRLTQEAHLDTIERLMIAAEHRDHDTAGHIERIGLYSGVVARALGLSPGEVEMIRHAAPMHDVGKLGVPDRVLLKPGKLDEAEWALMRAHTTMGGEILAGSSAPVIQLGERIALSHHERWDGSGYPKGLAGDAIALEGRICAIVDFFDALTMDRPYRKAVPNAEVIEMMRSAAGAHFDRRILDVFFGCLPEITGIQATHRADAA